MTIRIAMIIAILRKINFSHFTAQIYGANYALPDADVHNVFVDSSVGSTFGKLNDLLSDIEAFTSSYLY